MKADRLHSRSSLPVGLFLSCGILLAALAVSACGRRKPAAVVAPGAERLAYTCEMPGKMPGVMPMMLREVVTLRRNGERLEIDAAAERPDRGPLGRDVRKAGLVRASDGRLRLKSYTCRQYFGAAASAINLSARPDGVGIFLDSMLFEVPCGLDFPGLVPDLVWEQDVTVLSCLLAARGLNLDAGSNVPRECVWIRGPAAERAQLALIRNPAADGETPGSLCYSVSAAGSSGKPVPVATLWLDSMEGRLLAARTEAVAWPGGTISPAARFQLVKKTDRNEADPIPVQPAAETPAKRNVEFSFTSSAGVLAGTLALPDGAGPFPAVVMLPDSPPVLLRRALLVEALRASGFAVLAYDKRGFGASDGLPRRPALSEMAEDLDTAVRSFSRFAVVDGSRIAVAGIGEGAAVAALAASRNRGVKCVALVAGAYSGRAFPEIISAKANAWIGANFGWSGDCLASFRKGSLERCAEAIQSGAAEMTAFSGAAGITNVRELAEFDFAKALGQSKAATLILHGADDDLIPAASATKLVQDVKAQSGRDIQIEVIPGFRHNLSDSTGESVLAPQVVEKLVAWLKANL